MTISDATYGGSVMSALGCLLVTAGHATPYPQVELDDLLAIGPDVIAVPSEPYEFTDAHLEELQRAAPAAIVTRIDGQDLFWWGTRTPGAMVRLHRELRAALAG